MKIKSANQQITEKRLQILQLIKWQNIVLKRSAKRYKIKRDWIVSFWLLKDSDYYRYAYENEKAISDSLTEYYSVLAKMDFDTEK